MQTPNIDLKVGLCLDVLDPFMAKAAANRDKDREFNMELLRHGFVKLQTAIDMVSHMPLDDKGRRDMRARIRRWSRMLEDRGFDAS